MFSLHTPGGGGYGKEEDGDDPQPSKRRRLNETFIERGSVFEYRRAQESVWEGEKKNDMERGDGEKRKRDVMEMWKGNREFYSFLQKSGIRRWMNVPLWFICRVTVHTVVVNGKSLKNLHFFLGKSFLNLLKWTANICDT